MKNLLRPLLAISVAAPALFGSGPQQLAFNDTPLSTSELTLRAPVEQAVKARPELGIGEDDIPEQADVQNTGGTGVLVFGRDYSSDRSDVKMTTIKKDAPLNRVIASLAALENYGYVPYPSISEAIQETTRIPTGKAIDMINSVLGPYGYRALVRNGVVEVFGKNIDESLAQDVLIYKFKNLSFVAILKSPRQEMGTSVSSSGGTSSGQTSGGSGSSATTVEKEDLAAKDAADFFKGLSQMILSKTGRITFDPKNKAVIARDLPPYLEMLRQYLVSLDKPQRSVVTRVKILSVSWNPERNQGIDYSSLLGSIRATAQQIPQSDPNAVTNATASILQSTKDIAFPGVNLGNPNVILSIPNLSATLNLVRKYADIDSVNELTLVTQESAPAHVFLGDQLFIVVPGTSVTAGAGVASGPQTFQPEVGDMLTLATSIMPGNRISMAFNLASSRESAGREFSGNVYPQFHKQNIQQILDIPANHTVVLSGFLGDSVQNNQSSLPILGSIPVLGPRIFGNSQTKRSRQTVLFLVTPSIMDTNDTSEVDRTTDRLVDAHKTNKKDPNKYILPENAWRKPVSGLSDNNKRPWVDPTKPEELTPPIPPTEQQEVDQPRDDGLPIGDAIPYDNSLTRSQPSLIREPGI